MTDTDRDSRFVAAVRRWKAAGRQQQELAAVLGVAPGTVSRIMRGTRTPSEALTRYAEAVVQLAEAVAQEVTP